MVLVLMEYLSVQMTNDHRSDAILIFNILHRVSFVSLQHCFRMSRMLAGFHLEVSSSYGHELDSTVRTFN